MKVWLDDERPVPEGYTFVARTASAAIQALESGGVEEISLDHDLGVCEDWCHERPNGQILCDLGWPVLDFCPCSCHETGYTVVCWMEEHGVWPKRIRIHTSNPVGRQKMEAAILGKAPPWTYQR